MSTSDYQLLPLRPSVSGLDLDDRKGLVIGATGGLGQAIVKELLDHGATLFVHGATNQGVLSDLCANPGVSGALADFADETAARSLFDQVEEWCSGQLGFLIYCAGCNPSADSVVDLELTDWDQTMAVNVRGAFLALKFGIPMIRNGDPGKVVIVSSIYGIEAPMNRAAYSASKHALTGLVQTVSKEEGASLHINALCVGPAWGENVKHIFAEHARNREISVEEYTKERSRNIPARRFVEPSELARTVALFCSRATDYTNGECIKVTGGACQ